MTKIKDIDEILENLGINLKGHFENGFYKIDLKDSNEFARIYSKLDRNAVNLEEPEIEKNSSNSTVKWISYFTYEYNGINYRLFLFGNFDSGTYYLKLSEE